MRKTAQNLLDKRHKTKDKRNILLSTVYCLLSSSSGFTLIEVLVAITILATLVGGVLLTLNPIAQINKSQDAQRFHDLSEIRTALDVYYHDKNCYPTLVPFGGEWRSADQSTVYMKKVPQDPKFSGGTPTYEYRTDGSACPQWGVVFAKLINSPSSTNACPLSSLSGSCAPAGYANGQWACTLSGAVNCGQLASNDPIDGGWGATITPGNSPTPLPTTSISVTPTPPAGSVIIDNVSNINTNPWIVKATIMPWLQNINSPQGILLDIKDDVANVTNVKVILYSDGDPKTLVFNSPSTGTRKNGTWGGGYYWQVTNTYYNTYGYDIIVTDDQGHIVTGYIHPDVRQD